MPSTTWISGGELQAECANWTWIGLYLTDSPLRNMSRRKRPWSIRQSLDPVPRINSFIGVTSASRWTPAHDLNCFKVSAAHLPEIGPDPDPRLHALYGDFYPREDFCTAFSYWAEEISFCALKRGPYSGLT